MFHCHGKLCNGERSYRANLIGGQYSYSGDLNTKNWKTVLLAESSLFLLAYHQEETKN